MRESYQRQDEKSIGRPQCQCPHLRTRRQFLTRAAILAAAAPTLGSFLAACSKSGTSSSPPTLKVASPSSPVKWDIPEDNKPIADGLAPEKNATLPAVQLRRLPQSGRRQVVRGQVPDQGPDLDVQRHRRGAHEDPRRQRRLRHLLPELRPDQQAGHRRPGPSDQPQLHPEHQQRVAELHQSVVRPGMALLSAELHLHHRHRMAQRPGARQHRRAAQSL